jgi:hypothetical protein
MSRFANLQTWSWSNCLDGKPFEIKVFARNVAEARQEVFAIFAEIERVKPHHEALEKELYSRYEQEYNESHNKKTTAPPPVVKKTWAQVTTGTSPVEKTTEQLRKEMDALVKNIPADFFNGCYAAGTFDYTSDKGLGYYDDDKSKTLGDFIRTTEPKCCGPVRSVSFRSCLDG